MESLDGKQKGDPVKGAARIFEVVTGTGLGKGLGDVLRLPLGDDCVGRMETKVKGLQDVLGKTREIAGSTGF
jgi:hypothetical protein